MTDPKATKPIPESTVFQDLTRELDLAKNHGGNDSENAAESSRIEKNLSLLKRLKAVYSEASENLTPSGEDGIAQDPTHWGHLKIIDRIGQGGFGTVYRAYDPLLERDVALKLKRIDQQDSTRNSVYIEEARRLARVHHPNVLAIHGVGVNDHRVGIWADLVDGKTVSDLLAGQKTFDRSRCMALLEQLNSALTHVHDNGLVHGDIKSDNVMIREGSAILMDFGAAQHLGELPRYGSPAFMAPELFSEAPVSALSDTYSLGALMYRMALGQHPPLSDPRDDSPPDSGAYQSQLKGALGRPFAALVARMMSAEPQQRPSHESIDAQLRKIRELPARRRQLAAVLAVIASLSAGLIISLIALKRVEQERERLAVVKDLVVESIQELAPGDSGPSSVNSLFVTLRDLADQRLQVYPEALADMQNVVGQGLARFGDLEQGLTLVETGLKGKLESSPLAHRSLAHHFNIVANLRLEAGDSAGAESAIRQSIDYFSQLKADDYDVPDEGPIGVIRGRTLLANLLGKQGLWFEQLQAHQSILKDRVKLRGAGTASSAVDYFNAGMAMTETGDPASALTSIQKAMDLLTDSGNGEAFRTVLVQLGLTVALRDLGRFEEAFSSLDHAQTMMNKHLPSAHWYYRLIDAHRAAIHMQSGQLKEALAIYDQLARDSELMEKLGRSVRSRYAIALLADGRSANARDQFASIYKELDDNNHTTQPFYRVATDYAAYLSADNGVNKRVQLMGEIETVIKTLDDYGYRARPEYGQLQTWLRKLRSRGQK
ncbi:MAG: protein kinase [Lysobacterales bacterium]